MTDLSEKYHLSQKLAEGRERGKNNEDRGVTKKMRWEQHIGFLVRHNSDKRIQRERSLNARGMKQEGLRTENTEESPVRGKIGDGTWGTT